MADLDKLTCEFTTASSSMSRLLTNVKKVGKNNLTVGLLQSRLDTLRAKWTECESTDVRIKLLVSTEQQKAFPYFANNEFLKSETVYWEVSDYITNAIHERVKPVITNTMSVANGTLYDVSQNNSITLPKIPLPIFYRVVHRLDLLSKFVSGSCTESRPTVAKSSSIILFTNSCKGGSEYPCKKYTTFRREFRRCVEEIT